MSSITEFRTAGNTSQLRRTHFSWTFLAFALVWGAVSIGVFSTSALHALNDTYQIPLDFPGVAEDWTVKGDDDVFTLCGAGLCLDAGNKVYTRLVLDIPVTPETWAGVDQIVYEATVTPWPDTDPVISAKSTSFIVARAQSSAGKNLRNLASIIPLDARPHKQVHNRISRFHAQTARLQFVVVVKDATSMKIDNVRFHTIKLSWPYRGLRAMIFLGWMGMLLLLMFHVLAQFSFRAKLISASLFTAVTIIGASQYASIFTKYVTNLLEENWQTAISSIFAFSNNASLAMMHVAFHFLLTLYLGVFSHSNDLQRKKLTYPHIFALNLAIAIGVECAQLGIPERSGDVNDLAAAVLGTVVGIVILQAIKSIKNLGGSMKRLN